MVGNKNLIWFDPDASLDMHECLIIQASTNLTNSGLASNLNACFGNN